MTATATANAHDDDYLPTSEQQSHADSLSLLDQHANRVDFGQLRRQAQADGQAFVLVFTRHFHCGMCMQYIRALAGSTILRDLGRVKVAIVGPGQWQGVKRYIEQCGSPPFDFYADPEVKLYKALGVTTRNLDLGDPNKGEVPSHHTFGTLGTTLKSVAETFTSGSLAIKGGDIKQLGGEIVWSNGGEPVFAHRMKHTRDHSEVSQVERAVQSGGSTAAANPAAPTAAAAAAAATVTAATTASGTGSGPGQQTCQASAPPTNASSPYGVAGSNLLPGKIVAITGASRGIGRACALACAAHGAKGMVIHYLGDAATTSEAQSLQVELEKLGCQSRLVAGDISQPEVGQEIARVAQQDFGRLDVFVSNAGICPFMGFLEMEHDTWKRVQDVNLNGAFYAVQAAARVMEEQVPQGGSIVAVSSISALVGGGMQSHYTPTKAGIKSMMESASISLGPKNIRCNCVLPGTIETAINEDDLSDVAKRDYMISRSPLRRLGKPDDIAGPVVFLASDLSKFMTGSSVLADGGCFVNLQ
ncbi:uncharacterized protein PFL1_03743 [Pseudozyma flocculosa PF-1]|uniref:Related to Glucose 1-dehydrogenase / peroxisomal 2,4-dienoyl-CoA reductase n=2 Tax=Pseudozyma flocculosa TaxID=84751 RepID=A0A5C3F268_9BASI|nr:uncharacterized protein PFL1_03743 [Pseudozyma flocculosa PF-1]EPQ28943.1 hypothetical protein PFL1_03743 [Pseudozyma flocculosa PF-1]SPO38568.1 related to Glucose 1-dehydrogenase / peroxisomal 2,4-dienoyl-CoA reductase [Pseudozyma flocculosa]